MKTNRSFVLSVILFSTYAEAGECENGWRAYKDELCIKAFPNLMTYDDAKGFCSTQGTPMTAGSLAMVKESDIQDFLEAYTADIFEFLWLGGKYDEDTSQFKWVDGESVSYTNWAEGYPIVTDGSNSCIEMRPPNSKLSYHDYGNWADVNCQRRNRVICQRKLSWSLEDAVDEIIRNRKQYQEDMELMRAALSDATRERNELQQQLQSTREELNVVSSRVVPVGSIYIEYHGQPSPISLWPNLKWEDISSTYAGKFFRVLGGGSASWGAAQDACAPRVTEKEYGWSSESIFPYKVTIPINGWSEFGQVGNHIAGNFNLYEATRFHTDGCEVRPINQAIRIWKRTA